MTTARKLLVALILFSMLLPIPTDKVSALASPTILIQKTWGVGAFPSAQGIAIDGLGNIYVTGQSQVLGSNGTYWHQVVTLLKYDSSGTLLWQRIWSGNGNGSDVGQTVAVDASGNGIYVVGTTTSFGAGSDDALLLKFNSTGSLVWQRTWGGRYDDYGYGLALGPDGSVYVTGLFCVASPNCYTAYVGDGISAVFLLKFNPSGTLVWQRTWGSSGISSGRAVAVDTAGSIYVAGLTYVCGAGCGSGMDDVLLLKFDSSGNLTWQRTWGDVYQDEGYAIAVDLSGNVYVTGKTGSPDPGAFDVFLLKFNPSGLLLWQKYWGSSGFDIGEGVAADASGYVYVAGTTCAPSLGCYPPPLSAKFYAFILKLDSESHLVWQGTWGGGGHNDYASAMALDSAGDPVVVGQLWEGPPYSVSQTNNTLWTTNYTPGVPQLNLANPTISPRTPPGTLTTPSGSESFTGASVEFLLKYRVPPTILFGTIPALVGSINFNGTNFTNGQIEAFPLGTATIIANPPSRFKFTGWTTTGGVSVANLTNGNTTAAITGAGSLTANFALRVPAFPFAVLLPSLEAILLASVIFRRRKTRA